MGSREYFDRVLLCGGKCARDERTDYILGLILIQRFKADDHGILCISGIACSEKSACDGWSAALTDVVFIRFPGDCLSEAFAAF